MDIHDTHPAICTQLRDTPNRSESIKLYARHIAFCCVVGKYIWRCLHQSNECVRHERMTLFYYMNIVDGVCVCLCVCRNRIALECSFHFGGNLALCIVHKTVSASSPRSRIPEIINCPAFYGMWCGMGCSRPIKTNITSDLLHQPALRALH